MIIASKKNYEKNIFDPSYLNLGPTQTTLNEVQACCYDRLWCKTLEKFPILSI